MSTAQAIPEQRLVLYGEPWRAYVRLLRLFDERRHLRITYDRGLLEITTLSPQHENYSRLLGRFIEVLTEELNLSLAGYGSMTLENGGAELGGLEADQCFWIAHEAEVRHLATYDPDLHPPPDLIVEIEITRSAVNRLRIYAKMRVPEVWRYGRSGVSIHVLGPDGRYAKAAASLTFPFVKADDLERFLRLRATEDEHSVVRAFRQWVREQITQAKP